MITRLKSHIFSFLPVLVALLAGLAMTSCADDMVAPETGGETPGNGEFTVTIKCAETTTRATEDGDDSLNENLIETVTVCLWPNGGDWLSSQEPMYMETFPGINRNGSATLRLPLTEDMISKLFNADASRTCRIFVAVNVDPGTAKTVDELRALAVSSTFDSRQKQSSFTMDGDGEAKYISAGNISAATAEIEVRRSAARIDLQLDVTENVTETVNGYEVVWTPDLSKMRVMLHNGVKDSQLDPRPKEVVAEGRFDTPASLTYSFAKKTSGDAAATEEYPYAQGIPFYTYPNLWDNNQKDPVSDVDGITYMTLSIPWTPDGGKSYRTCYYRVPVVNSEITELVRNTSYHVRLRVSMLGSFVPEKPYEVEPLSYSAAKWGTENIDVDINEVRYLVVDQNDFEVDNESNITIPFYTSHETEVISAKMTFSRFNFSDEGTEFDITVTDTQNKQSLTKGKEAVFTTDFKNDKNNSSLTVKHELKAWIPKDANGKSVDLTNGDKKYEASTRKRTQTQADINKVLNTISYYVKDKTVDEYSKVVFEVTVQHSDKVGTNDFKETVKITQYPAMYISSVKNYTNTGDAVFDYSGGHGSTYINNNYTGLTGLNETASGGKAKGWMTSIGLHSAEGYLNWNPNMYLITVSTFNDSTNYRIGDPRIDKINNDLGDSTMGTEQKTAWGGETINGVAVTGFVKANSLYYEGTKKRTLTYYYPTDEADRSKRIIAPKFRICSSYAGTGKILTRALARRRAAAFQEMGYAAGRWRLPTYAEVEFVMQLAADLKIPRLFGRTSGATWYYWCANGAAEVPAKTAGEGHIQPSLKNLAATDTQRARFVYDEWYWGKETLQKITPTPAVGTPQYEFTWGDRPINTK